MITKQQALQLSYRTEIYHGVLRNADHSPLRARVNGKCKTWARQPARFQLPIKHGLRDCGYLSETNCDEWYLDELEALRAGV